MKKTIYRMTVNAVLVALMISLSLHANRDHATGGDANVRSGNLGRPAPDRVLTDSELKEILTLCDLLVDRRQDQFKRERAAWRLGMEFAHKHAIQSLVAVLRDRSDQVDVRQRCVLALSWTADKRIVDFLIDAVNDREINVAGQALDQLNKLTGFYWPGELGPDPTTEPWRRRQERWRKWWEEHREDAVLRWDEATSFR